VSTHWTQLTLPVWRQITAGFLWKQNLVHVFPYKIAAPVRLERGIRTRLSDNPLPYCLSCVTFELFTFNRKSDCAERCARMFFAPCCKFTNVYESLN